MIKWICIMPYKLLIVEDEVNVECNWDKFFFVRRYYKNDGNLLFTWSWVCCAWCNTLQKKFAWILAKSTLAYYFALTDSFILLFVLFSCVKLTVVIFALFYLAFVSTEVIMCNSRRAITERKLSVSIICFYWALSTFLLLSIYFFALWSSILK